MSPTSEHWEELIVWGWGGMLQLAQVNTWWSDDWLSLHCLSPPTNVFLFQGRHMMCFSFSPLSYIVFSHKFLLQSLTQKCNKTQSYIGTASSEIGAGVFQERKYAGCTEETLATTLGIFSQMKKGGIMGPRTGFNLPSRPTPLKTQSLQEGALFFFTLAYSLWPTWLNQEVQHFLARRPVVAPRCPPYRIFHRTFKAFKQDPSHILLAHPDSWLPSSSLHRKY